MAPKSLFILVLVSFSIFLCAVYFFAKPSLITTLYKMENTKDLIDYIKEKNCSNPLEAFTFVQETVRFDEQGGIRDTTTWYEAIRYPKDFRIDFGDHIDGNANINRNDSIYVFRENRLVHKGPEIQEFLILEGGLCHYSSEETLQRLEDLGIDTSILTKSNYDNRSIYIIGALENELEKPQIWVDLEKLYVVRRFSRGSSGALYDVKYDSILDINGYWIETWLEFYRDGKLIQTEKYNDIDVDPRLNDSVFDPDLFGKHYWFEHKKK